MQGMDGYGKGLPLHHTQDSEVERVRGTEQSKACEKRDAAPWARFNCKGDKYGNHGCSTVT